MGSCAGQWALDPSTQHHDGHSALPICIILSPGSWAGPAGPYTAQTMGRGSGTVPPELGTPHRHLTGREHSTASLGESRGRQLQGVTAPAPTTHHEGKLRHDGFKHTSTGQAWPCTLPGTITSTMPRGTVPRGTVHGGAVSRSAVSRSAVPRGTVPGGMTPKEAQHPEAQYSKA